MTSARIRGRPLFKLGDVRSILDAHYLHRDPALGDAGITKLEAGTKAPKRAPNCSDEESAMKSTGWGTWISNHVHVMSVILLKADIRQRSLHVRLVPIADVASAHHLGACGQCTSTPSRSADRSHDASLHVVLSLALEGEDFWSGRATPAGASSPPRPSSAAMAFLSVARMRSRAVASTALGSR